MATNQFTARRVLLGIAPETTPGTSVAPVDGLRHMKFSLKPVVNKKNNESAIGRVEQINESHVFSHSVDGAIEGKVGDLTLGYILKGTFGSVVTSDNADSNPVVKDHTFDVAQTNNKPTFTLTPKDPLETVRHALAAFGETELSVEVDDYLMVKTDFKAKTGVSSADSVAVTSENEFLAKHIVFKKASALAGLGAASAIDCKSLKLKFGSAIEPYTGLAAEPTNMLSKSFVVTGEAVLHYTSTEWRDLHRNNTAQAIGIYITNTDVTIGASANPKIVFTAPQTTISEWDRSDDLDEVVEQTIGFSCEMSISDGYALRAVLTNTKANY